MTDEQITAGKKLIAEFMGFTIKDFSGAHERYIDKCHENAPYYEWHLVRDLKYHTSYDWLMPVLDKLAEDGYYYAIYSKTCYIDKGNFQIELFKYEYDTPVLCLFSCVVKAIEHYNNNKTK